MDASLFISHVVDFASAPVVVSASTIALAQDVRFVYFFLCGVACHGLVLVGSGIGIQCNARRRMEKTFHHGRDGRFSDYVVARDHLNQRLDATAGP